MWPDLRLLCVFVIFVSVVVSVAGCATPKYEPAHLVGASNVGEVLADSPRHLPMFTGSDGQIMSWQDLLDAVAWAEIVILGESHDDEMAHRLQLALVKDSFDRWPGSALSMEMLERDEQVLVDDYYEGIIDARTFIRLTFSENWGGEGSWEKWYQPIIVAARSRGNRLIAANAPRRYVRLARTGGYEALRALPGDRRGYFSLPRTKLEGRYFERFGEVMFHLEDDEAVRAIYRSQLMWDATMADSIIRARPSRSAKVLHLVGRFHSDFEGGLVQEIRKRRPWSRVLVLSMVQADGQQLREGDAGRADVVIYTGAREELDGAAEGDLEAETDDPHVVH